ncbi:hypothetical protein [Rubrivirga sp.]|uniref:hypothetical protein n=1 Tax=Rubrivirga sp. TaxID=1885344 RepID=UPI003C76A38D
MRHALPIVALLLLAGCDTTVVGLSTPVAQNPAPVPVTVTYRVAITGTVEGLAVRYTNGDGRAVAEAVDRERDGDANSVYVRRVQSEAGAIGTFQFVASGTVDDGRIAVAIIVSETGNIRNLVAETSAVAFSSVPREDVSVAAEVYVPVAPPSEE